MITARSREKFAFSPSFVRVRPSFSSSIRSINNSWDGIFLDEHPRPRGVLPATDMPTKRTAIPCRANENDTRERLASAL
jgi:hypothetical protein